MTATGARPTKYLPGKREPRPCPTCYTPMVLVGKTYECAKHGAPVTPDTTSVVTRKPPKVVKPLSAKVTRPRREPRYPSDLKTYPLPPAPDGRDHGRVSAASPTTARSRLTPTILADVLRLHDAGQSPWQIAETVWTRAGYASRDAAKGSIFRALRASGRTPNNTLECPRHGQAKT